MNAYYPGPGDLWRPSQDDDLSEPAEPEPESVCSCGWHGSDAELIETDYTDYVCPRCGSETIEVT